jgi:hypothetical protein
VFLYPHVGFTGTRKGMTLQQYKAFKNVICDECSSKDLFGFHHGDCLGADAEAHQYVASTFNRVIIHIHPPKEARLQAFVYNTDEFALIASRSYVYAPLSYIERNRIIVNSSGLLIAAPDTMTDVTRSGTWSTVRFARKKNVPVILVYPDGTVVAED